MTARITSVTIGRGYRYTPKSDPATFLAWARQLYQEREKRPATYCAINPAGVERFAPLWPGCVVEDRRVLKNEIFLGRDDG